MTWTLAMIGDSIAYGQGATRAEDTAGARLVTALVENGFPAQLDLLAVPGARSDALAAQVARARRPELAVIVVGANDLTHFVAPRVAADQLGASVRTLRAGGAQVVVAPAPDMSSIPGVPAQLRPVVRAASATLRQLQTAEALAAGARVADVEGGTSSAFAADTALFSADRFHPSSAGYALIARALLPAVLAAARDVAA